MKKPCLLLLGIALIFGACSKSSTPLYNNNDSKGITATLNGKVVNFSANILVDTTGGEIDITGSTDSLGGYPVLEFSVTPPKGPIKPGLYQCIALAGLNAPTATLSYITNVGAGSFGPIFFQSTDDSVIVNSISPYTISGTFHGHATYKTFDGPTNIEHDSVITISHGTFNINL